MDLKTGQIFDEKYKILSVLGKGGMGKVYLAQNVKLGTLWAIKQVNKNPNSPVDLLAEPNIMKKLNHPSLPRIFDIIENDKAIFIVLDYVEGISLDKELKRVGKFSEKEVVEWAKQICEVYIYLHEHKPNPIIYRDMKPSNLMKMPDGTLKVIDFGIAREYKAESNSDTQLLGTEGYAAPEQRGISQTDERSDIYSLAVTLYHLVTGFGPRELLEFKPVRQIDSHLSEGLEEILHKALRPEPKDRHQTARELLADLNNIDKKSSSYKRERRVKGIKLASSIVSFGLFLSLTFSGFSQIKAEQLEAYEQLINSGKNFTNNHEFNKAQVEFEKAMEKLPEDLRAYQGYARNLYMQGDYEGTIQYTEELFQKLPSSNSEADLYYLIGSSFFELKDYTKASAYFQRANDLFHGNVTYMRDLAVSLAKDKKINEAQVVLENIKKSGIDEEVTWYVEGELQGAKGDFEKAIHSFESVVEKGKDANLIAKSLLSMAKMYKENKTQLQDNNLEKRIQVLETGLEQSESTYTLLLTEMLAEAYYEKGSQEKNNQTLYLQSIERFNQLIDYGYERPYIYRNIAIIYQKMGRFQEAEKTLGMMKEKYPTDYTTYMQFAMLYADMENKKEMSARDYSKTVENYELALKFSPEGKATPELQPLIHLIDELKRNKLIN